MAKHKKKAAKSPARRTRRARRVKHATKRVCGAPTTQFHDVHGEITCVDNFGVYHRSIKKKGGGTTPRMFARKVKKAA